MKGGPLIDFVGELVAKLLEYVLERDELGERRWVTMLALLGALALLLFL